MVLYEGHHATWVGIEIVKYQTIVDAIEASPLTVGLLNACRIHASIEREVHHGLQVAVLLGNLAVALPSSSVRRLFKPSFPHHVEVGIFLVDGLHPARHRTSKGIGIGIHANAIDAHCLNPPDAVLNEIVHHMRIVLVEVGHSRYKPTLNSLLLIHLACVRVEHGSELVASAQEVGTASIACAIRLLEPFVSVEPIIARHIGHPRMLKAAMVENHVHYNLQALAMCIIN